MADAALIAAAPELIAGLIAECVRLRAEDCPECRGSGVRVDDSSQAQADRLRDYLGCSADLTLEQAVTEAIVALDAAHAEIARFVRLTPDELAAVPRLTRDEIMALWRMGRDEADAARAARRGRQ